MTRTVARALAESLHRHGMTYVFGQSLPSLLMLECEEIGIRQIAYRTENAGGAMADAAARMSGRISVVTAQNGPAATLLVPPLAEALKASVPILALVQEVPAPRRERNAFQELDHARLFAGVAKWMGTVSSAERAEDLLDLAITQATTGRPGPVVLMLPKDILAMPAPEPRRGASLGHFPLDRVVPDPARVVEAATMLATAEDPIVVAGGGVHLSDASAALTTLQARLRIPVATTNMGKGAVDETHPLSVGVVGNTLGAEAPNHPARDFVRKADVALLIGTRTNENGTDAWSLFSDGTRFIHLDIDGGEIGRNYEAVRLAGDARLGIEALLAALDQPTSDHIAQAGPRREAEIAASRRHARTVASYARSTIGRIDPRHVMSVVEDTLPADAVIVADASFSTLWVTGHLRARVPGQRFLTPRGLAGLGWGYPMALGAQVARPEARIVCVSGDGGFGHVWGELETAVRERLPVTLILLNNSILGFQKHSELDQFGRHTSAIGFGAVDHAAVARAAGAAAWRVRDIADLSSTLGAAMAAGGPALIEVMADAEARPAITAWDSTDAATAPIGE